MNRLVLNFFAKDLVPTYRPLRRAPSCQIASIRRTAGGDEFCRRRIWLGSELMADEISNPMTSSEGHTAAQVLVAPGWSVLAARGSRCRCSSTVPGPKASPESRASWLGASVEGSACRAMLYSSAATTQRIKMRAWLYM